MSWSRTIALAGLALLAACGFEPLHAPRNGGGSVPAALATVQIANIPDRSGQILRNYLRDEINPYGVPGNPRYRLDIFLTEPASVNGNGTIYGEIISATTDTSAVGEETRFYSVRLYE